MDNSGGKTVSRRNQITVDMDGQECKVALDIGADEPSISGIRAHVLLPSEVGVAAKH